jgi:hypothetical protein
VAEWFKEKWAAIAIGFAMFVAALAAAQAAREKASARQWKDRAVADTETGVEDDIESANAALSQAKLHEAKADEAIKKTRDQLDKIGKRDETLADTADRWRKSNRLRSNT